VKPVVLRRQSLCKRLPARPLKRRLARACWPRPGLETGTRTGRPEGRGWAERAVGACWKACKNPCNCYVVSNARGQDIFRASTVNLQSPQPLVEARTHIEGAPGTLRFPALSNATQTLPRENVVSTQNLACPCAPPNLRQTTTGSASLHNQEPRLGALPS